MLRSVTASLSGRVVQTISRSYSLPTCRQVTIGLFDAPPDLSNGLPTQPAQLKGAAAGGSESTNKTAPKTHRTPDFKNTIRNALSTADTIPIVRTRDGHGVQSIACGRPVAAAPREVGRRCRPRISRRRAAPRSSSSGSSPVGPVVRSTRRMPARRCS